MGGRRQEEEEEEEDDAQEEVRLEEVRQEDGEAGAPVAALVRPLSKDVFWPDATTPDRHLACNPEWRNPVLAITSTLRRTYVSMIRGTSFWCVGSELCIAR